MSDKDFGVEVDVGAAVNFFGPLEANILKLEALADPAQLSSGQLSATEIQMAASVVNGISALDSAPMGANVFGNFTVGGRVSNYGLGLRTAIDLNSTVVIDNTNVGFSNIFTSFTNGAALPTLPAPTYFTAAQANSMVNALTANAGLSVGEANAVVAAYDSSFTGGAEQQQNADVMITIAAAGTDLTNNTQLFHYVALRLQK